ncbi:hypothetical protein F0562_027828 [Nyssa sinensis]|uniref:Uncharacterized protein n=1 Tax=Nyssa sinensis TaxID=561372 RepID=A0A5J5B6I2_9ASTE|nr:hypothetical protein F0562_027828 [Nyssa sinensis]
MASDFSSSLDEQFTRTELGLQSLLPKLGLQSLPPELGLQRKNLEFCHNHQIVHSDNPHREVEASVRNAMEPKPQKMINRPIEKFHTEILPLKLAKSIPAFHHKLLSSIKSAGFLPSKNTAHIMEAAAKIIKPGPQVITEAKMPPTGSLSAPLKVRDLKEKSYLQSLWFLIHKVENQCLKILLLGDKILLLDDMRAQVNS